MSLPGEVPRNESEHQRPPPARQRREKPPVAREQIAGRNNNNTHTQHAPKKHTPHNFPVPRTPRQINSNNKNNGNKGQHYQKTPRTPRSQREPSITLIHGDNNLSRQHRHLDRITRNHRHPFLELKTKSPSPGQTKAQQSVRLLKEYLHSPPSTQ